MKENHDWATKLGMSVEREAHAVQPAFPSPESDNSADSTSPANDELSQTQVIEEPIVIEDGVISKRVRRPLDLVRFTISLLLIVAVGALAFFATATASGIGADIEEASRQLPDPVRLLLNLIGGLGLLVLPVGGAVDLLIRGRGRQLLDSLISLLATVILLTVASILIQEYGSERFVSSLAGSTAVTDAAVLPLLAALVAFVTTARLVARAPWAIATVVVLISLLAVSIISGTTTIAGITISVLAGWAVGLAARYIFGTPTTRPTGELVAATLAKAGHPVRLLQAQETTDVGRRYSAEQVTGPGLEVFVLDRDLEGSGLVPAAWSTVRLRDSGRRIFNMRRSLEQRALMAYAAQVEDVPASSLVASREIGPDSSLLAYERNRGIRLSELPQDRLTDEVLDSAWETIAKLQTAGMAHRRLTAHNMLLTDDGTVQLLGIGHGSIAAGDVTLRIDVAELLCTLALLTDPERAIAAGTRVLGTERLIQALPVLQPVALSSVTKRLIRKNKSVLVTLRDSLVELKPDAEVEKVELERIKPRTIIMIVLGSVAAYFLFAQLAQVDLVTLFTSANWWWLAGALIASLATYPASAWQLSGFVPERLKLWPTMMAQLAGDFATLVAPPTLGAVAINLRYLQKVGIHPALATASIGVSQVAAFAAHTLLLLGFGIIAGTQSDFNFDIPMVAVWIAIALLIIIGGLVIFPPIRQAIWKRVGPLLKQVGPRLVTLAQTPSKLLEGLGGILLLNLGYIICLAMCVQAFGGDVGFAAVAVVYLTGSVIGQAAPTPGGLGAVEAAMAAGLVAAGLDGGLALSAVLLYRVVTFWLPTVPGWFAFNWLQRKSLL